MKVINKIEVHLDRPLPTSYIRAMQSDAYTRVLEFALYSGGAEWAVPAGTTASVAYSGASGKGIYNTLPDGSDACTIKGNIVTAVVVPQALAMHGDTMLTVVLQDSNGNQLSMFCVMLCVEKNPAIGATKPDPYVNIQQKPNFATSISWLNQYGNTDKLYVLPDGLIYGYLPVEFLIQIETVEGCYYDSNGEQVVQNGVTGQRTNLIPVKEGERFEVTSAAKYQASVIWFDSAENKISHETYGGSGAEPETVTVSAPSGAASVRFYSYGYNGATYLAVKPLGMIAIETSEGGYYNANGDWVDRENITSQRTNLVPVEEGDQFQVTGMFKHNAAVIWFDSAQAKLSHETYGDSDTSPVTVTVVAPSGAAYARFYSYGYDGKTYLEVRTFQESRAWGSTGHAFVPADYEDRIIALEEKADDLANGVTEPLFGKKIVYDGDSICYGAGYTGGYAKIIAELTGGTYENQAQGGGRLVTKGSHSRHSVVDNLPNLPTDGDLYCFEGGVNDYWTSGMKLGTFDYSNFEGELDTTTVCGALETIFRYALNNFVGKPVCFVIAHKVQETAYKPNSSGNTFKEYHDAMVGICQKYSIPYYDAFAESGLNGWNDAHNEEFFTDGDGCHPNEAGYRRYYVPQLLELFRKIIPQSGAQSILYFDAIKKYLDDTVTETWVFELEDGTTVSKEVMVK